MDPIPELISAFDWPDPNPDGTTTLPTRTTIKILDLLFYVETQYAKCAAAGKTP
jgi:hypothetical protein